MKYEYVIKYLYQISRFGQIDQMESEGSEEMQRLIHRIVGLCMKVHRYFGPGRNEKIYENSLAIEFRNAGIPAVFQAQVDTFYQDELVGRDILDCLVDDRLVIEFKAAEALVSAHEVQLVS